jgi:hypothetical protein
VSLDVTTARTSLRSVCTPPSRSIPGPVTQGPRLP